MAAAGESPAQASVQPQNGATHTHVRAHTHTNMHAHTPTHTPLNFAATCGLGPFMQGSQVWDSRTATRGGGDATYTHTHTHTHTQLQKGAV